MRANRLRQAAVSTLFAGLCALAGCSQAGAEGAIVALPDPAVDLPPSASGALQSAVFAGGCFWGVQAVFQHVEGVTEAVSGYAGGSARDAHYDTVSHGGTGHAESVKVTWDPKKMSYGRLLKVFFSVAHDPTQLNRQGPDHGTQYRSAIFYASPEQQKVAAAYVAQLEAAHVFPRPVVTKIDPLEAFFPAEAYHQDYARLHPDQPYIMFNDLPKLTALKVAFPAIFRSDERTVPHTQLADR